MPNWKKVIVSGSDATLRSIIIPSSTGATTFSTNANTLTFSGSAHFTGSTNISGTLIGNGLIYPIADGTYASQVLQTDAAGNLTFGNVETTFDTIYNGEATTLVKGTPVYISGSNGAAPKVYRADASNPNKMPVVYIVSENITSANTGRGITLGHIDGIDLTGYNAGTAVYVAEGGGWTSTRPTGSSTIIQFLGLVTKAGNGGKGLVLNPGPVVLPNLQTGYTWVGNGNNYPLAVATSSLSVNTSSYSSYALTASYALNAAAASGFPYTGSADITGSINVVGSSTFGDTSNYNSTHNFNGVVYVTAPSTYVNNYANGYFAGGTGLSVGGDVEVTGSILVDSFVVLSQVSSSLNYANDTAAASGGVPLGGLYHTSGTIKIRLV